MIAGGAAIVLASGPVCADEDRCSHSRGDRSPLWWVITLKSFTGKDLRR